MLVRFKAQAHFLPSYHDTWRAEEAFRTLPERFHRPDKCQVLNSSATDRI